MPTLRDYKVFISHAWAYSESYNRIVSFLESAPNFYWTNLSVPRHDPLETSEQLTSRLNDQMRPANVFLILGGMYVSHSDWIQYEINFARRIGRPIIGIRPWASERTPDAVARAAKDIVGWNTESIVRAIRNYALSDGR
ncbi:MAG: TIR domain-containing protein [Phycisphaera sp.]|nr:MAG: TIR domain-containing protein [Phycisphaera sp.]